MENNNLNQNNEDEEEKGKKEEDEALVKSTPKTKIVLNKSAAKFALSSIAWAGLEGAGFDVKQFKSVPQTIPRHDPKLVSVVEDLGTMAGSKGCVLVIEEIPTALFAFYHIWYDDGVEVVEYDWRLWFISEATKAPKDQRPPWIVDGLNLIRAAAILSVQNDNDE